MPAVGIGAAPLLELMGTVFRSVQVDVYIQKTKMATAAAAIAPPRLVDKKGTKTRVWKYFAFEADDRGVIINPQKPLCKRCYRGLQTKGGNTSNLAKHLKDRHPDLFKEFKG